MRNETNHCFSIEAWKNPMVKYSENVETTTETEEEFYDQANIRYGFPALLIVKKLW